MEVETARQIVTLVFKLRSG